MDPTTPEASPAIETPPADETRKRERSSEASSPQPDSDALPTPKRRKLSEEPKSSSTPSTDLSTQNGPYVARPPAFTHVQDVAGRSYYSTNEVPMNRQGFRYSPAGPSPPGCLLSHRSVESQPAGYIRVSWEDRSPYLRVSSDGLSVLGEKGFRSARLNVPVKEGKWYMEVKVEKGGGDADANGRVEGAHVRLGWARREAPLNGPAGMDGYSYAYRDKTGEKVTLGKPKPYGRSYGSGDVIGLYISLPPRRKPLEKDSTDPARVVRKRIAINYKNQLYFESMDYAQTKEMQTLMEFKKASAAPSKKDASMSQDNQAEKTSAASRRRKAKPMLQPEAPQLRPLPTLGQESCVAFFVNGECQGPAFTDLYDFLQLKASTKKDVRSRRNVPAHLRERENPFDDGSLGYYPILSVFNDARVVVNAGPDFDFPPPPDLDRVLFPNSQTPSGSDAAPSWRPLSERYGEHVAEEAAQDEADELAAQRAAAELAQAEEAERLKEEARVAKKKLQDAKKAQSKKTTIKLKRSTLGTEVFNAEDLLALEQASEGHSATEPPEGPDSLEATAEPGGDVNVATPGGDSVLQGTPGPEDGAPSDVDVGGSSPPDGTDRSSAAPSQPQSRSTSVSAGRVNPPSNHNGVSEPGQEVAVETGEGDPLEGIPGRGGAEDEAQLQAAAVEDTVEHPGPLNTEDIPDASADAPMTEPHEDDAVLLEDAPVGMVDVDQEPQMRHP